MKSVIEFNKYNFTRYLLFDLIIVKMIQENNKIKPKTERKSEIKTKVP